MTEQNTLQKALYTIKKLKQMVQDQSLASQPIAIIGMSSRFPDANGKDAYWKMLSEGRNVISKLPEKRWDLLKGTYEDYMRQSDHPYWGGFIKTIADFDAYFFGISPREAARIDPQHRLLLEVAYEAFEDAGLSVESLAGSNTGVFSSLYVSQLAHMQQMDNEMDALFFPTGNAISIAANRISYLFDLHGPSIIVDSACSSSMASLQLACLNLQNKTCDVALVCGAKLNLLPYVNYVLTKAKMLSVDGQCKTFDADANGYVQGEGVGVIVLKPLHRALEDNDRIYSVILGSAVNQDGKTNGLTAPNGLQQEALLRSAYQSAKIQPHEISYVECHGTGTFLGDPIEIEALGGVVSEGRSQDKPCIIGSVKTNIGHLEPAAGIASVMKVALALNYKKIPPHLNFINPNPHIDFDKYYFKIPTSMQDWPDYGDKRIAGISGFGFGGTNAHVVMREVSDDENNKLQESMTENQDELFTLSAKDSSALKLYIHKWIEYLENNSTVNLEKICYNLHLRRSHYFCRLAIIAKSTPDLLDQLKLIKDISLDLLNNQKNIYVNLKKDVMQFLNESAENNHLSNLAISYVNRVKIDWISVESIRRYKYMDMPLYPWQHKEYWPPLINKHQHEAESTTYPLHGKSIESPLNPHQFEFMIDLNSMPDLEDTYHVVHAGYYMEMFSYAIKHLHQVNYFMISDHVFLSPLFALKDVKITVQLVLEKMSDSEYHYHIYSKTDGQKNWVHHAEGNLSAKANQIRKVDSVNDIKSRCGSTESPESLYEKITAMGMPTGESIRWTHQYWSNQTEILCEFQQPASTISKNSVFTMGIHPGIIDGSIQPLFKLLPDEHIKPYIASGVKHVTFYGLIKSPYYLWAVLKSISETGDKIVGDCYLINENREVMAEFLDMSLTQLNDKVQIQKLIAAKENHEKIDLATLPIQERKSYVVNFLCEQIALIFSMPKDDIEINRSLRDMGIDSLTAIVLMRTLEMGLGANFSLQNLLEGPSIADLAEMILNQAGSQISDSIVIEAVNPWIAYRMPQKNPRVKLFCFPYGGGGASVFRDWQNDLPATIEVCPIQLPGRENRLLEKPIGNLAYLIDVLIESLQSEFSIPFAFFGHSFGSLIAFELTRTLRERSLPQPSHLFVSAFPDPRTPTKSLDKIIQQLQSIDIDLFGADNQMMSQLSDKKLAQLSAIFNENGIEEYGDHLLNREVTKILLPIFSGDMGIVKSYQFHKKAPLDIPLTVFIGKQDTWVSYDDHLQWVEHTTQRCDFKTFDSGHLFIKELEIKLKILHTIEAALLVNESKLLV